MAIQIFQAPLHLDVANVTTELWLRKSKVCMIKMVNLCGFYHNFF